MDIYLFCWSFRVDTDMMAHSHQSICIKIYATLRKDRTEKSMKLKTKSREIGAEYTTFLHAINRFTQGFAHPDNIGLGVCAQLNSDSGLLFFIPKANF